MKIIIAGAGKVGFNLARTLSEVHEVTVIDRNAEALQRLHEHLDILPVHGDIEDPSTYRKLIDKEADLFIAVTDLDEANLISTLIVGDRIEVSRKFIRLRNEFFARSSIREKLGITDAIFPLQLASETVEQLFAYPRANNVKRFAALEQLLISVRVSSHEAPGSLAKEGVALVGIERGRKFWIPEEDDVPIEAGDLLYLFGDEAAIRALCERVESESPRQIERCVVFGAGALGVAIARKILDSGREVKLIDKDLQRCELADEALEGEAMTLSCKYGTEALFAEEGLESAEMMIAATDDDEYNIIKCLEAREHGIAKVVAINNEMEYYHLMHRLGLVVVRGPKMSAYHRIIEQIHSTQVVTERQYCGGEGRVYLRRIYADSPLAGRRIKPYRGRGGVRLFLVRGSRLLPFVEAVELAVDDVIVGFGESESADALERWFDGL